MKREGRQSRRILVAAEDDRRLDITERQFIRRLRERHYGAKENRHAEWTADTVAERFVEAAETARLAPVGVAGATSSCGRHPAPAVGDIECI